MRSAWDDYLIFTVEECCDLSGPNMPHEFREIALRRLYHQMKMVVHHDVGVKLDPVDLKRSLKLIEKNRAISVVAKNCFSFIPTAGHVIMSIGEQDS
jgi:hypothetical protein